MDVKEEKQAPESESTFDSDTALSIMDGLGKRLAYVTGQRDGMRQAISMILTFAVIFLFLRRFYGHQD
jgi:hypothetical protein